MIILLFQLIESVTFCSVKCPVILVCSLVFNRYMYLLCLYCTLFLVTIIVFFTCCHTSTYRNTTEDYLSAD